jgi:hypothetical protein
MADYNGLGLFDGKDKPTPAIAWKFYDKGLGFNAQIKLEENVKLNRNFYISKQWEGVESNGLPTPQFNFLKRTAGFIVANITSDNIRVTATALANTVGTNSYKQLVDIVNDEFEAIIERNKVPARVRKFASKAAIDGDGCLYTYWDAEAETGQESKGAIVTEVIDNTRVFFGNPNDPRVQSQPWIIICKRETVRNVKIRAKNNGSKDWKRITEDDEDNNRLDAAKYNDGLVTVLMLFWRDDNGVINFYECTRDVTVKEPTSMDIKLYPICWLNWDEIADCYHGQAMITGLIPNQVFVNKSWAMTQLNILRSAFSKVVFDSTRVKRWDNRVGGAIAVTGNVDGVAKILDPAPINPQVSQFIQLAVEMSEQSLGATSVALGDTRPDNTSAIIALQRAASTPNEITKQNLYDAVEDLFRIYLEFMGEYYGKRFVDSPITSKEREAVLFAQPLNPDLEVPEEVPVEFDFSLLKEHPVIIKLDVGASTYYSEIAATQTLDNLLMNGHIDIIEYLERVPDDRIPGRRALLEAKIKARDAMQQAQAMPPVGGGEQIPGMPQAGAIQDLGIKPDVPTGSGYSNLQRTINKTGTTEGLV